MGLPTMMRVLAVLAILLPGCSAPGDEAGCATPLTVSSSRTVQPGEVVTVFAEDMWDGCDDQGLNEDVPALKDQAVTWTQSGTSVELARVDADDQSGEARVTVTVPLDSTEGKAEVSIGFAQPALLTVVT